MSTVDAVAAVLWVGVTAYAVLGGADFGAGFWSLFAGRGERGRRSRELVDWAIGPVWEANHVWLIFVLVVLWTAFSSAFAAIFSTLFIPLSLAALGIVLRGAGFAFHKTAGGLRGRAARHAPVRPLVALDAVLHGHRGRSGGRWAGARRQRRRRSGDQLAQPALGHRRRAVRRDLRLPRRRVPRERGTSGGRRPTSSEPSRGGRSGRRSRRACSRSPASSSCAPTRARSSTG